ncbi:hypothetical protein TIFTF001_037856 [Ficus carica]|uniref:Jacalin-type lectin domain-containing protein n=1 Tax=Ficus carica TaxID=3494 RepID=A0AA88J9F1_FICCA|nr:hypothetical protein TIFTF001_037856 [Ficus carica]
MQASKDIVVGPWGGSGDNGWDDGSYTKVRQIELSHRDTIDFFSVLYDLNGQPFDGPKHPSKHSFPTVKFLVSVSGNASPLSWLATTTLVVCSFTFKTNKRIFGPYGQEEGTPFNFPIENSLIVGFNGRTGELLDAIGFHLTL